MRTGTIVRRVPVPGDAQSNFGPFDYADAFALRIAKPDSRPAADWLRAGLEDSPPALRQLIVLVHRHAQLEASGPWFRGVLIGTKPDESTVRLDTFLEYKSRSAAVVWRCVGPLHRAVAPYLLKRAAFKQSPGSPGADRATSAELGDG